MRSAVTRCGDVDELVEVGHGRAGLLLGAFLLGQRGALLLGGLEEVVEHGAGGAGFDLERLPGLGVLGERAGDGPGGVVVAAAGQRHVGRGGVHAGADDRVGGVDGAALRGVHRGGVGERDVLGDVAGGQLQGLPRRRAGGAFDGEPAVRAQAR